MMSELSIKNTQVCRLVSGSPGWSFVGFLLGRSEDFKSLLYMIWLLRQLCMYLSAVMSATDLNAAIAVVSAAIAVVSDTIPVVDADLAVVNAALAVLTD